MSLRDGDLKERYSWIKHIDFIIIDILSLLVAFGIAYNGYIGDVEQGLSTSWKIFVFIFCVLDLGLTLFVSPYSGVLKQPGYMVTVLTGKMSIYLFFMSCVVFYVFKIGSDYSRVTLALTLGLYFVLASLSKTAWKKYLNKTIGKRKNIITKSMIVVCEEPVDKLYLDNIQVGDMRKFEVKAVYMYGEGSRQQSIEGIEIINNKYEFETYVMANRIDAIFISASKRPDDGGMLKFMSENDIAIYFDIEKILGFESEIQSVDEVGIYKTLKVKSHNFTVQQIVYMRVKRLLDMIVGVVGCIVTFIVAVPVKIAFLLRGDNHSIFYSHIRVGLDGVPFRVYKFRTMVPGADEMLAELLQQSDLKAEWEKSQKLERDPRVTAFGKKLRNNSLDELPQFFNVLNGTMSLVGPRPLVPDELKLHNGLKIYNKVKPGITGWWACNGRSNIEYKERLEMEYYYIKNVSFGLDIVCLLRTIKAVLVREGAK